MTHARTAAEIRRLRAENKRLNVVIAAWFFLLTGFAGLGLFGLHVARINAANPNYEAEQKERSALRYLLYEADSLQHTPER